MPETTVRVTKTGSRTKKESLEDVENNLGRLQIFRIDIIQLHGIDIERTIQGDGVGLLPANLQASMF